MVVRRKSTYHEGMMRAGWEMPSLHAALCSLEWMEGIRAGIFYCPRASEVKFDVKCYSPPPKLILLEKLNAHFRPQIEDNPEGMRIYDNTLEWMADHPADVAWLVKVLAIHCQEDEIFGKSWRYVKKKEAVIEPVFDNQDGFFNFLP